MRASEAKEKSCLNRWMLLNNVVKQSIYDAVSRGEFEISLNGMGVTKKDADTLLAFGYSIYPSEIKPLNVVAYDDCILSWRET